MCRDGHQRFKPFYTCVEMGIKALSRFINVQRLTLFFFKKRRKQSRKEVKKKLYFFTEKNDLEK